MSWLLLNGLDGVTLGYQRDHQVIDPHQPQPPLGYDLSANELTRSRGTPPRPGRPQGAFSSWPAAVAGVAAARLAHRPDGTVILFGGERGGRRRVRPARTPGAGDVAGSGGAEVSRYRGSPGCALGGTCFTGRWCELAGLPAWLWW